MSQRSIYRNPWLIATVMLIGVGLRLYWIFITDDYTWYASADEIYAYG